MTPGLLNPSMPTISYTSKASENKTTLPPIKKKMATA
jgi:hypothetical protein